MNRCGKCIVATVVSALVAHQPLAALAHANSAFTPPTPSAHTAGVHNAALTTNAFHNLGYGNHGSNVPGALSQALQLSGANPKLTFLYSTPVMQLLASGHTSNHIQSTSISTTPSTNTQTTSNSATSTGTVTSGVSLNLASQAANLTANISSPVTIRIGGTLDGHGVISGGTMLTVKPGQLLTPAEYQALMQVQLGGSQTLVINGKGNAASGYLQLDTGDTPSSGISTLVVPRGVTVDTVGYTSASPFVVNGAVKVYGNLVALQPTSSVGSVLNLGSLNVSYGAKVTDILPSSQSYLSSLFNSSSLTLNVVNGVTNSGSITSGGTLTVNAGGTIANVNSSIPGATPALMSGTNVVLSSTAGNFTNNGTISASSGDVSFKSPNTINLTNTNGQILAQSGNINFRDSSYTGSGGVNITGGSLLSQNVNVYSGTGNVTVNANSISGANNVWANTAHISTSTGTLNIGTQNLAGDPTYYSTGGNVVISNSITTTGNAVAVAAQGNVTLDKGVDITTQGGQINLIAGAQFTSTGKASGSGNTMSTLTVTGGSKTGGSIELNNASLNSSAIGKTGNGGNVDLVAFAGSAANSGTISSTPGSSIETGGRGAGENGSVTVIAGATSGQAITLGKITTTGGTGLDAGGQPTGNIQIYNSTPVVNGPLTIKDGAITAGSFSPSTNGGNVSTNAGSITTGALTAGGQHLDVYSGNNVNLGNLTNNGIGAKGQNEITVYSNSSSTLNINGTGSKLGGPNTTGLLTAESGSINGSAGGSVTVINNGTGGVKISDLADINVGVQSSSGNGGNISLLSNNGTITLGTGTLSANGRGDGDGGTINISGTNVVGGSGNAVLSANAMTKGDGGSITVTATAKEGSISSKGTIDSSATRGAEGGNGGSVSYTAGGNINPGANATINVGTAIAGKSLNPSGNGGNISLVAGTGGNGNVTFTTSLNANGVGTGNGGNITISSNSAFGLVVKESVSANSGTSGSGGQIVISNSGATTAKGGNGGVLIENNLTATGTNGNGGYVSIAAQGATPGKIIFESSVAKIGTDVNVSGTGNLSNGGTINITGGSVAFDSKTALIANGAGQGGSVSLTANGLNGGIIANGGVTSSATGGTGGGTVEYTAAGDISIGSNTINVNVVGQNGNGGIIHLEAGTGGNGNVTFGGALSANGIGTGNGGQIVVDARSANTLTFNQAVSANAGSTSGVGGSIQIDNDGSGGVNGGVLVQSNLSAYGVNGNGGVINLTSQGSTPGEIAFATGSKGTQLIDANSTGSATSNGGTIQITGGSVKFQNPIQLTSNAAGSGTGGLVSAIANGENGNVSGSNVFSSATGGSKGSQGGDGGTVEFTAAGNVNLGGKSSINVNTLGQNGNGGVIHLEAGTGGNGDVTYAGALSANGVGTGNGGQIVVDARSASSLTISQNVSANAGSTYGHGGSISIDNDGSGGKNGGVLIENNLSAYGVNSNGGDITITSQGSTPGKIVFESKDCFADQLVNVSAYGTQWGNGGQLNITGGSVQFNNAINLNANASGPGTGGLVSVIANGENGSITGKNVFSSATGGSKWSAQGDGGTVEFTAAGNVSLGGKSSIDVNVLGADGNGGVIHLEAGTGGNGDVYFSNTLSANGAGIGNGGQIVVDARSGSALVIAQDVSANAGYRSGLGGTISIDNDGSGGKNGGVLIENNLSAYGVNSNGGDITVTSQGSTPGKIVFESKDCFADQLVNVSAYGTQWGNGGQINITGGSVQFNNAINLNANASGPGTGGLVSVIANGENGSITGNNVFSSATGGSKGSTQGDGGTVEFTAAGNVKLGGKSSIDVDVLGKNGNGGVIHLEAGTGGNGDVYFSNTLSANGAGVGNGGQIVVDARSGSALVIAKDVSANAGSKSGVGGTISIDNDGSGGKNGGVLIENNLSAYGVNSNGGDITVTSQGSTPGKIVFESKNCFADQLVNVSAYGTQWGNGGQINITGGSVQFNNSINLNANASGPGTGGLVSVIANGENGSITGNNVFSSATGGSKGSTQGDGGTVEFTAAGNVKLGGKSSIDVDVLGKNGNGGVIHLEAGTGGNGDVYFANTLSANGAGVGNGGQIVVDARSGSALVIAKDVSANAGNKSGVGGTISIDNDGSGNKNGGVLIENNLSAYGVNSNGGDITVTSQGSTPGKIVFDEKNCGVQLVNVSAYGTQWGNGGQINITGGSVQFDKSIDLTANASGPGTGGLVSVIANGQNGSITGKDVFSSATGGSKGSKQGDGGTVEFTAAGNIKLGSKSSIDVNVLGINGNGGVIHLEAGTGGNGNVYFSNTLAANGKGTGNGGQILVSALSGSSLTLNQDISANGGSSGSGGTVTIQNLGSGNTNGGIKITNDVSANGYGGGNGGNITITAQGLGTNGVVTFGNSCCHVGEITANASGNNSGNGGTISITGSSVHFDQRETVSANGANFGSGGTVGITALNGNVVAQCPITILANGGASGGAITVSAYHNVDLDNGGEVSASATKDGSGGTIAITAGTSGKGNDYLDVEVLANGSDKGNGGCIQISAQSQKQLVIDALVEASSGKESGNGGTVLIYNTGSNGSNGGIKIDASLLATGTGGGNGGIIGVYAGPSNFYGGNGFGNVVINEKCGGEINASATGSKTGNGGAIGIIGSNVEFKGSETIAANGSGSGNGGLILVAAATGSITSNADTNFSATGGSKGSFGGNGGTIALLADKNVELKGKGNIDVDALGKNGNGGNIGLVAGLGGNGNIYTNESLEANGVGKGNGGYIYVSAQSGSALVVKQDVSANGGSNGSGGNITIQNLGISKSNGGVQINENVTANGNGGGNGGTILITAEGLHSNGVVTFGNGCCHVGEITANANGAGNGGTVTITGSSVHFDQRETVAANAINGVGGTVNITALNGNVVAQCPINILANGGASGGTITVSAYHNVDLDNGGKVSASDTKNGNGGTVSITAGTSGKGNDYLNFEVLANGSDKGNGGCIQISAQSQKQLVIDALVEANSGKESGNGGTVLIYNTGSHGSNGGIKIDASLLATGTGGGNGGIIGVYAGPSNFYGGNGFGNVVINEKCGGEINASATGSKTGNGGAVGIIGSNVEFKGSETIAANGSGSGNGGLILIAAATGSITSSADANFSATGGSKGSFGGNGGTIALLADKNVELKGKGNIDVDALGKNGNGGNIGLVAGLGGNGNVYTNESLEANGVGKGNGGYIYVSAQSGSTLVVKQDVSANGGSNGSGGNITIKNLGTYKSNGGVQIDDNVTANGNGKGNGGTILITADGLHSNGVVTFGNGCCHVGEITANANGSGNGGKVTIIGSSVSFDQRETVAANAANGIGGTVNITALNGSVIAQCPINITANGGSSGGTINVTAQRNVDLDNGGTISADATKDGNGGCINVTAGKGGNGTFDLNTTVTADGAGHGSGGSIKLASKGSGTSIVDANVEANGGTSGAGGTIKITNVGSCNSNGGLRISADVTANGTGGHNGGSITISALGKHDGVVKFDGQGGEVEADAKGSGNGGTIKIEGSSVYFNANEKVAANGGHDGKGGTITIDAKKGSIDADQKVVIVAKGGVGGGTIDLFAKNNIDLGNGGRIDASATKDGKGGTILAVAGQGGNGTFSSNTTISANGAGKGNGGDISLLSRGSKTSDILGTVSANSGDKSGKGGVILIQNLGAACGGNGGILLANNISATGSGGDKGGEITINAGGKNPGNITFEKESGGVQQITVNATGTKTANGGKISVTGNNVNFNDAVAFSANAAGSGNGGAITIEAIKGSIDGNAKVSFSATGGSVGSKSGNGGTLTLSAGANIKLPNLDNINVGPLGKNGNGGDLTFKAGTKGEGILQIGTGLNVDGVGKGNGGTIKLSYNDGKNDFVAGGTGAGSYVNGNITADATGAGGKGGTISISNGKTHDLNIVLDGNISAINTTDPNNTGLYGNLNFINNGSHSVAIVGPGQLLGITNAHGSSVYINPQHIDTQLTTGLITATTGSISLIVDCPTSRIVIPTGSLISTLPGGTDILIQGPTTYNYGTVSSNRNLTFATNNYYGNGVYTANGKITFEPCPGCGPVSPPPDHHHTGSGNIHDHLTHTGGNGQGGPFAGRNNGNGDNNFLASNQTNNNTIVQNSFVPNGGSHNGNDQFVYSKTATDITEIINSTNLDQSNVHNGYLEEDEYTKRRSGNSMIEGSKAFNKGIDEQNALIKEGIVWANGTNKEYWNLDKGNILFNPEHDIVVGTHEGDVHIAAGSSVFVMETGHDVYVYNLHQSNAGKVFVSSDKEMIKMDPGGLLVLTKNKVDNFEELDGRCHWIGYTGIQKTELKNGVNAFSGRFSIPSAFSMVVPLKKMLTSSDNRERQLVDRILKSSVLLSEMIPTNSPFQNGDMSR